MVAHEVFRGTLRHRHRLVQQRQIEVLGFSDADCRGQPHCRHAGYGTRGAGKTPAQEAGNALVPVVATLRWSPLPHQRHSRADPLFVTQLIATAELIPQTCALRRATPTEALAAYRSTANQNQTTVTGARMRQIA